MKRRRLIVILLACLMASAFLPAQARQPSPADAPKEPAKVKDRLVEAVRSKRLDDIAGLFSPDGAFLSRTTGRVSGRAAIRGLFEKVLGSFTSDITMTSVRVERSGDLAYDTGDFEETVTSTSDATKKYNVKGNYLLVLKRERGSWLIVEQVMTDRTQTGR
ncbi:MAG: YybH family protein [Pyrinomonadaceae bacterium]